MASGDPMRGTLPVELLEDGHTLVLGTTGSGKTYRLRGFLEQLRRAHRRVGAVDKLGNHWGLTLDADGEAPGLDFVIFGGKRAHVPMRPGDGDRLGRLFVERSIPAIFDVSQWHSDDQEEWIAGFADAVFTSNESALHLAFDEAQSWVPQGGGGDAFKAVRRLAEQGRGNGIRLLLSCQRLSRLDATVRGMMHGVIAMRQPGVIDRRAVVDLISASKADQALIEAELPKMPTGTGFLWTADDTALRRIAFPPNATFDSSRTPRHGDAAVPRVTTSSELVDELRALLAPPAPEPHPDDAIPDDPAAAYAAGSAVGEAMAERERKIEELERANAELQAQVDDYRDRLGIIEDVVAAVRAGSWRVEVHPIEQGDVATGSQSAGSSPSVTSRPERADADAAHEPPAGTLPPRHQRLLDGIAWANAYLKRSSVPRAIVAWIADTTAASSTFERDCGALRTAGLISYPAAGELALTNDGGFRTRRPSIPATRDGLWSAIKPKLPPRQVAIIGALRAGGDMSRAEVAAACGTTAQSSTLERDLGRLRTLGLVEYPSPGHVRLGELLR